MGKRSIKNGAHILFGAALVFGGISHLSFATGFKAKGPVQTRPMSAQKIDGEGNLWFLSANDSHKNAEIKKDPHVKLMFQGSPHSDLLNVYGKATITTDKKKIKELWEPIVKAWFTEGIDDPRMTVIKVAPSDVYYWDNKHVIQLPLLTYWPVPRLEKPSTIPLMAH